MYELRSKRQGKKMEKGGRERRNTRRNNKRKNKKKSNKSKKAGKRKNVKNSQNYLAPPSDSYGASFDYEEDYNDQARDDYSGPVQPAVQAARDFSVPSNSYGGPTAASGDYGAPPASANREYSAPSGDYSSPSNGNYGAPT